ncbi:MAG: SPFH domain-containing protein [Holosporaceae bacterium]|jgi:regulator of protease activity HflC (stomatin/prohibitin superfamily)|nr:SPFH domain-containing protein [Holosporaceae bacterium]
MEALMELFTIFAVFVIIVIVGGFFVVQQQTCAVIERFGKFYRIAEPGLRWRIPKIDSILSRLSFRIHQLDVAVETKTLDNVFVNVVVAVQYKVLTEKVFEACYTLQDPEYQIRAFVFDLVRAQVPKLVLDDVFSKKDDIADAVKMELEKPMSEFGYGIIKALVTDINPDQNVKAAMNEINTAQRLRVAAAEKGEAEKILRVKQAEAEAEASILHGKGIAGQRQAIIEGLGQSVEEFVRQIPGTQASHVMDMVLLIQYIDTLKEIAAGSKSNVIFVPHSPGSVSELGTQIRETIFAAQKMGEDRASGEREAQ